MTTTSTPVATQLQDLIVRASAAIAGRENWGRTELEILRRDLAAVCEQAKAEHRGDVIARMVIEDLCVGVEKGVANLAGLAQAARRQAKLGGEAAQ
ncbi:MAG: hypothetical protein K2X73_04670 [Sphingomonas sp.]|uniref:hypothetical protein n=1 Tax=Sphingomonas sp. TaxID=28214 RepID=UPI0025F5A04D|nr:hypothetical protein [Sphingomonas sp.]MBX9881247.1 hypothetical protein [Sphingomonas sp.]